MSKTLFGKHSPTNAQFGRNQTTNDEAFTSVFDEPTKALADIANVDVESLAAADLILAQYAVEAVDADFFKTLDSNASLEEYGEEVFQWVSKFWKWLGSLWTRFTKWLGFGDDAAKAAKNSIDNFSEKIDDIIVKAGDDINPNVKSDLTTAFSKFSKELEDKVGEAVNARIYKINKMKNLDSATKKAFIESEQYKLTVAEKLGPILGFSKLPQKQQKLLLKEVGENTLGVSKNTKAILVKVAENNKKNSEGLYDLLNKARQQGAANSDDLDYLNSIISGNKTYVKAIKAVGDDLFI